ncbi:MAG: type II secretion system minor pseudopilin GspK [Cellvibrionaceae bacterium]
MSRYQLYSVGRQRGTVLIISLLVVTIIIGLAVSFSSRFQVTLERTKNRLALSGVQQCLYSVESGLIGILRKDKKDDVNNGFSRLDHFDEDWAQDPGAIELTLQSECLATKVKLSVVDAQSLFNLNRMGDRPPNYDPNLPFETRYTEDQKRFIRLLQTRDDPTATSLVSSDEAEALADAVIDWIDADDTTQGVGGAETGYYLSKEKPHRAANQPFVSVSELLLVKGFEDREELYKEVAPLLVALPNIGLEPSLNVNTADVRLLRTVNRNTDPLPIDLADAEQLVVERPKSATANINADDSANTNTSSSTSSKEFESISDFQGSSDFKAIFTDPADQPNLDGLDVGSDLFFLVSEIEIGGVNRRNYGLIERSNNAGKYTARVIRRGSDGIF